VLSQVQRARAIGPAVHSTPSPSKMGRLPAGPPARVLAKLVSYLQNPSALALGDVLIVEGLQQPIGGAVHISE
jgi:hypothetical protein